MNCKLSRIFVAFLIGLLLAVCDAHNTYCQSPKTQEQANLLDEIRELQDLARDDLFVVIGKSGGLLDSSYVKQC